MGNLIKPIEIEHNQYEKLVDDVYILGQDMILRMNVVLGRKRKDGNRYNYHNEYMYSSNKYLDMNKLVTVRRSYDFYFTIENMSSGNFQNSIMIRPQDMYNILDKLDECRRWFTDEQYSNLYAYSNDNKLVIVDEPQPVVIKGLAADKRIVIEPTIITYENIQLEGVRMYVNDLNNFTDITIDRFMGFVYLMNTVDMFSAAQHMISYLGRPPIGENIVVFNNEYENMETVGKTTGIRDRRVKSKSRKSTSFFDKIDNI